MTSIIIVCTILTADDDNIDKVKTKRIQCFTQSSDLLMPEKIKTNWFLLGGILQADEIFKNIILKNCTSIKSYKH